MKTVGVFAGVIIGGTLIFYAVVGALFLNGIQTHDTSTTTCDFYKEINGHLWCMAAMKSYSDNITVTRQEEQ